jgi:MinD superfamily P-loop ATPase
MVHAALGIAEDNSGKLVTQIRSAANSMAVENGAKTVIIDGPPGLGCPVIASITGTNLVLAVTEPTLSGLHDLGRILTLAGKFNIKSLVCINKYDLNTDLTDKISTYCSDKKIKIAGMIPFDRGIVKAVVEAHTHRTDFYALLPGEVKKRLNELYLTLKEELENE